MLYFRADIVKTIKFDEDYFAANHVSVSHLLGFGYHKHSEN